MRIKQRITHSNKSQTKFFFSRSNQRETEQSVSFWYAKGERGNTMTSRGTTPTYILTFPDTIDLTTMDDIKVTIADSSYNNLLTFEKADLTIDTTSISVFLSQEQTLALPLGTLLIQVNMTFTEGGLVKRIASEIVRVQSAKNLYEEVMS